MTKQPPPKPSLSLLPTSLQRYFEAKRTVLDFEVKECLRDRDFERLALVFNAYEEHLHRHPTARDL